MAQIYGEILSPWDGKLPLFCSRYNGMRSEDVSLQAAEFRVMPEPNLCTFRFWTDSDGLARLEADADMEVLWSQEEQEMP